jgi:UTP-glucose-1-phosphate uridylyltransferase
MTGFESVLLAAGRGRRMMPLTAAIPKTLLPLGGEPLLHHVLRRLEQAGSSTTRILIDDGPSRLIRDHLDAVRAQGCVTERMLVSFEEVCTVAAPEPMQALASITMGRLPVLAVHSDELIPAAISAALARLSAKYGCVVTAMVAPGLNRPRLLQLPEITEMRPGETPPTEFRIVGQAALPVAVLHRLTAGELPATTLVGLLNLLAKQNEQVLALTWPGPYLDVGELWRYQAAVQAWEGIRP